jgi:hypothetical protein
MQVLTEKPNREFQIAGYGSMFSMCSLFFGHVVGSRPMSIHQNDRQTGAPLRDAQVPDYDASFWLTRHHVCPAMTKLNRINADEIIIIIIYPYTVNSQCVLCSADTFQLLGLIISDGLHI